MYIRIQNCRPLPLTFDLPIITSLFTIFPSLCVGKTYEYLLHELESKVDIDTHPRQRREKEA